MLNRMFPRLLLIVILLSSAALVSAQNVINVGDSIDATASAAEVNYDLKLAEGQAVEISLVSDDFDALVRIADSAGTELASDDDGGEFFNSLLSFTAPSSETFTIIVSSFGGSPDGTFTLSVTEVGSSPSTGGAEAGAPASGECGGSVLAYNCTITVSPNGATQTVFTFEGTAGDAVDISAVSLMEDEEDSELVLFSPGGRELVRNDDGGEGFNPLIKRFLLPETGTYTLELVEVFDTLSGDFDVTVTQTEALVLGSEDLVVTMGEDVDFEVLTLEVERGVAYSVTVVAPEPVTSSLFADFLQEGETFANTRFTVSGFNEFTMVFEPIQSGIVRLELDFFSFSNSFDFVFSVTQS